MAVEFEKLLPQALKNDVWIQFMEALSEEYTLLKEEKLDPLARVFDVDYHVDSNDADQLKEIATSFGYTPDVTIFPEDIAYLERELRSIPFRIAYKSLPVSYDYLFKSIGFKGEIALFYWNGQNLIRSYEVDDSIESHDWSTPYRFKGNMLIDFVIQFLTLDFDPTLYLDSSPVWTLDQQASKIPTSHISLEFVAEQLFIEGSDEEYLITKDYLAHLLRAANNNRKVSAQPHPTLSLNAVMDTSGWFDNANRGSGFSVEKIKLKNAIGDAFDFDDTVVEGIQVGTGSRTLPAYPDLTGFPTTLEERIYTKPLILDNFDIETSGGEEWFFVKEYFPGNSVNEDVLGVGDDSTRTFTANFQKFPITEESVEINYTSQGIVYSVTDDGEGILSGERAAGTLDYSTGAVTLNTFRETTVDQVLHAGTNLVGDPVAGVDEIDTFLGFTPIVAGTFRVSFTTGGGNNFFIVSDNGDGTIGAGDGSDGIAVSPTSTIDYTTGELHIYFSQTTDTGRDVSSEYVYTVSSPPDSGTEIQAAYTTEIDLDITEAGLFDDSGDLVAYATFPPVNLGTPEHFFAIQFFIRRKSFFDPVAVTDDGGDVLVTDTDEQLLVEA